MGFVLSTLYFVINYLTPPVVFGPLEEVRIELIIAGLLFLVSLPALSGSIVLKTPQSVAVLGLAFAGSFSVLFGRGWVGGAVDALPAFFPCALAYFLVCLHCNSKKRLQVIVLMLLFVCLFVIAHGYFDLLHGVPQGGVDEAGGVESAGAARWNVQHPYLLEMQNDQGEMFYRVRGLGSINDPNDFGQLIVCVIPLVFIFWRPRRMGRNMVFVIAPVCVLLFGIFLTHSRGALLALTALTAVAARRRIGTLPALLIAGGVFAAAMALHFTGGREISANSGSDRTALWGEGLQMLKAHPFFGVGLGSVSEFTDSHLTLHNSVVVCAAEIGLVGLYFWCLFLFPTVRNVLVVASLAKKSEKEISEAEPISSAEPLFPRVKGKVEEIDKEEVRRMGSLVFSSLTGFLVAGWFLSRSYVLTFFLLGGIAEVVFQMALDRGMVAPRLRLARLLSYTGGLELSLVLLMYIMLRTANLMH
ncbi:MAG: O-antigen ligase family protein [Terracidiphilus sp.]|jgi:hypothetical protein